GSIRRADQIDRRFPARDRGEVPRRAEQPELTDLRASHDELGTRADEDVPVQEPGPCTVRGQNVWERASNLRQRVGRLARQEKDVCLVAVDDANWGVGRLGRTAPQ